MLDFLAASHKTCPERMPCGAGCGCGRTSWRCARPAPLGVLCGTASLERAPAWPGRSRDRLNLRPQLLGGVRMAGLERLLASYPHPDAAAIWHSISFAAFAERRRGLGDSAKFLFTRAPARAEPKELRGAARRPPRRFARYASLTAGAGRARGGAAGQKISKRQRFQVLQVSTD